MGKAIWSSQSINKKLVLLAFQLHLRGIAKTDSFCSIFKKWHFTPKRSKQLTVCLFYFIFLKLFWGPSVNYFDDLRCSVIFWKFKYNKSSSLYFKSVNLIHPIFYIIWESYHNLVYKFSITKFDHLEFDLNEIVRIPSKAHSRWLSQIFLYFEF